MSFLDFFGARYALKALVILSLIAGFVIFAGVINTLLGAVIQTLPTWASTGAYFLPENASACAAAVGTAQVARWVYDWQKSRLLMIGNG